MANVYIVRGSEDGNLGVFANVKAAVKAGIHYAGQNGERELEQTFEEYAKEVRATGGCYIEPKDNDNFGIAEITRFLLERK